MRVPVKKWVPRGSRRSPEEDADPTIGVMKVIVGLICDPHADRLFSPCGASVHLLEDTGTHIYWADSTYTDVVCPLPRSWVREASRGFLYGFLRALLNRTVSYCSGIYAPLHDDDRCVFRSFPFTDPLTFYDLCGTIHTQTKAIAGRPRSSQLEQQQRFHRKFDPKSCREHVMRSICSTDEAASRRARDIIAHVHKSASDEQHSRAETIRILAKALQSRCKGHHVNVHLALDTFNETVHITFCITLFCMFLGCPITMTDAHSARLYE
jgi:hypothetical protein